MRRSASVLVGLLWCIALLTVVVIGVLHSAFLDLRVVKNHGDLIQARYLALAGIEKAKALLYHDAKERKRSAKSHGAGVFDAPQELQDVHLGRGQFRVIRQGQREEGGKVIYGVSDEESRLNLNTASASELAKLAGMTPEVAASILDWRDADNDVQPGGAEAEYYASLQPPSLPRNGPLQTTRELLMIRGVSRDLFLGEDTNQNGLLDPEEDDGKESFPPDNQDGVLDSGWSGAITVDSSVRNENAAGQERINIQSADAKTLARIRGITSDLGNAIVAYRNQNQLKNLADLLEVTAINPQNQVLPNANANADANQRATATAAPNPPLASAAGPRLISESLFMDIADDLTAADGQNQPGAINLNTASTEVLSCLPGLTPELAQAIVAYRKSAGFFSNIGRVLQVDGMTRDIFKQFAPEVCVRSETFRILSEGRVASTGARQRIQVVVRLGVYDFETLSYREDL